MKKQFKPILTVLFFVLSLAFNSFALGGEESDQSIYAEAIEKFEKYVPIKMDMDHVPGLSVGFLKDDFTWTKGFGYSDLENMVLAKSESSYRLASITKTMTAIAVLQLVEAGKIELDAEVQTYVPYFPKKKWPVTVRLLLGHLGGISHYKNYSVEGRIKVHKNTKQALAIFQDFDLVVEPGTKYNYSSYGFNLLGAVIEGASGHPYANYITENIFKPFGMKNSRIDDPISIIPYRVRGYRLINGQIKNSEYVDISSRFAGGGTRSTVVDLLKYARGIMARELLKKETWREMFTSMAIRDGRLTGYGMGWRVNPWRGHFQVSHGGSQPETRTHLLMFPAENFAIAIASNLERLNLIPYIRRLAEFVLDEDMDSITHVITKEGQAIYNACNLVFSYGMSRFDWNDGQYQAKDEEDLSRAFAYFNKFVDENTLKNNFKEGKKKIGDGIHPVSNHALTKVGSFMAEMLKETNGNNGLQQYHKSGPITFFNDYIIISQKWLSRKKHYQFKKSFTTLISQWEKDWKIAYPDYVRRLFISINTDFDELGTQLKHAFAEVSIYPDFTRDLTRIAQYYLKKNELPKTFKILNLSAELYPHSPAPFGGLAKVYIWTGDVEKARNLFKKAFEMDPENPWVSLNEFRSLLTSLRSAKKTKKFFALGKIAVELYPKGAELYEDIGDMYRRTGKIDNAIQHYKKALDLHPELKAVKAKLNTLEKKNKK